MDAESKVKSPRQTKQPDNSYYVLGLIFAVILFFVCVTIAHAHKISGWQASVFYWFNNWPNGLTKPALWLSEGLGAAYPIILCVAVPALFKRFKLAWRFLVTVGGAGVVMEIGKLIAKEPRPVVMLGGALHERAIETGLTSFPSGHEAVATAMAMTLWLILPRPWRWLCVVWVVVVGVSRLYLGVHAPVDVLGGLAIGMMAACIVQLLPQAFAKKVHLDGDNLLEPGF
jgi:membrane-associated phospholipid phosphatase